MTTHAPNDFLAALGGTKPPAGNVALFWLEQSHFIFKTSTETLVHVDPFLSRVVKPESHIHPQPVVLPEDARGDFVFLTHDHRDHTDPYTLEPMARNNPGCVFVGPAEACARAREAAGVEEGRLVQIREGDRRDFPGFSVEAVYAQDTSDPPSTTHLGYIFDFQGVAIYHTGDTRGEPDTYLDRLSRVVNLRPQVLLAPVNEGYRNPGPRGAARLVEIVQPDMVVPCHYGCFKHNTMDPALFLKALPPEMQPRVRILPRGGMIRLEA